MKNEKSLNYKEIKEKIKTLKNGDILFILGSNKIGKTKLVKEISKNIITNEQIEKNKNSIVKNLIKDEQIIKTFNVENILDRKMNTLSTGEKTLVTILLNVDKELLIIDDILKNLDNLTKDLLLRKIKKLRKEKITIFVTTSADDILFGNKTLIMSKNNNIFNDTKKIIKEEKIFKEANITLPFIINLSKKLSYYDLVDKEYFEIDKLVNDLWK